MGIQRSQVTFPRSHGYRELGWGGLTHCLDLFCHAMQDLYLMVGWMLQGKHYFLTSKVASQKDWN